MKGDKKVFEIPAFEICNPDVKRGIAGKHLSEF